MYALLQIKKIYNENHFNHLLISQSEKELQVKWKYTLY